MLVEEPQQLAGRTARLDHAALIFVEGVLADLEQAAGLALRDMRVLIAGATVAAYAIYAAVRVFGIGDAADYDSVAFFGYAALSCVLLLVLHPRNALLAAIGSGSYFIYLWHIFVVMALLILIFGR